MSTANSENKTIAKFIKRASSTASWECQDWKECHKFFISTSSCVMQIEDVSLRFYLVPTETSRTEKLRVYTAKFLSLWVELLSDQMNLLIKVKTLLRESENSCIEKESQVDLTRKSSNSDSRKMVCERFICMGNSLVDVGYPSNNYDAYVSTTHFEMQIMTEIFQSCDSASTLESFEYEAPQPRSLVEDFKKLLVDCFIENKNAHHDVELLTGDGTMIPAHRAILAARSPVFQAMFSSGMKESVETTVPIKKIGSEAMKVILMYIYTEKIDENWENCVDEVVRGASMYDIPELLNHVDKNLIKICNASNALELFKLAKLYSLGTAMYDLTDFTQAHTAEVLLNMKPGDSLQEF